MTGLGIGASQLARALGISQRTVTYWPSGKITWPNELTRSKAIKLLRVNSARGNTSYEPTIVPDGRDWTSEAATDRRDALRAGGATLAGLAGLAGLAAHQVLGEPDHLTAALDAGSVDADRLTNSNAPPTNWRQGWLDSPSRSCSAGPWTRSPACAAWSASGNAPRIRCGSCVPEQNSHSPWRRSFSTAMSSS